MQQFTPTEAICPLCKDPVCAGVHSDPTRLCEGCRQMVQTIRSTSSTSVSVMDNPHARSIPQPPEAIPVQTGVQITNEVVAQGTNGSNESATQVGEPELFAIGSLAGVDRDPFDFDELFEDVLFGTSHVPESRRHSGEPSGEGALQFSPAVAEPIGESAPQPQSTGTLPADLAEEPSAMAEVICADSVSPGELIESDPASDCRIVSAVQPFLRHEVVTDPLEDPVQGPRYSQEDHLLLTPRDGLSKDHLLLSPSDGLSKVAKLNLSVAAALVVCCAVTGYFLMYRPPIQASQNKQAISQQTSGPVTARQAVSPSLPKLPGSGSEAKESQGLKTEGETSEGRYALQAAAFPNEVGANEFCARLKRAGVPAYVVSADIAGRGRWFRVRVGRFESAQDADRFASESRRRARAAGLNLQLIVSGYDKP